MTPPESPKPATPSSLESMLTASRFAATDLSGEWTLRGCPTVSITVDDIDRRREALDRSVDPEPNIPGPHIHEGEAGRRRQPQRQGQEQARMARECAQHTFQGAGLRHGRRSYGISVSSGLRFHLEALMEVPLLVDDFLRRPAALWPGKTAIVDGDLRLSYGDYQARVNQLSNALLRARIEPGDRVCILSPNSHYFLESFYATSQIGAILVPLNYRLVPADHEYILNHAGVKAVLVDHEYVPIVDEIRAALPSVELWIRAGGTGTASGSGGSGTGTGLAADDTSEDDGGCGCRTAGSTRTPGGVGFLALAGLASVLYRRRRASGRALSG